MNLNHLKHIIAIYRAGSITKASKELFIAQSSLSTMLKNMEQELGYEIFTRTSGGVSLTLRGEHFINYASTIVQAEENIKQINAIEYSEQLTLKLSVFRASYISYALSNFINENFKGCKLNIYFKETNVERIIQDVFDGETSVGIIRFPSEYSDYYYNKLKDRGLAHQRLMYFKPSLVISKSHPLAENKNITLNDLVNYTEIIYGDINSQELSPLHKNSEQNINRIYAYDRGSMIDFLEYIYGTYMWASHVPENMLEQHEMLRRDCAEITNYYMDIVIYREQSCNIPIINKLISGLSTFSILD